MGALIAPLAWGVGVAAGAWAWARLCPAPPGSPLVRRLAEPLLAGWVIESASVLLLALAGAAASPAAALAPVALALVAASRRRRTEPRSQEPTRLRWIEGSLLAVAAARVVWLAAAWPWGQPWGWDFYAVWGLKARHLVATGGLWRYLSAAAELPFSHAEYPLLLPAHLAAVSWPAGSGFLAALPDAVLAAAALALWWALWREPLGPVPAAALTLLLAWPGDLWGGHLVGLADRPVALLAGFAATLVALGVRERDVPVLAVSLAGLALLKNEGLPFAVVLALAALVRRRDSRTASALALALTPAVAWRLAVSALGLLGDRLGGLTLPADGTAHLAMLLRGLWLVASTPDLLVPVACGTAAALAALAVRGARVMAAAVLAQAGLLAAAVYLGPYPLSWQIGTALPRLVVQMLPASLACLGALAVALTRRDAS
ncbi:MAG: hypothetical protein HY825_03505 [Acidobacteria bacterium]|nr:hypothetical protein [Acidobacteriota bacterium]